LFSQIFGILKKDYNAYTHENVTRKTPYIVIVNKQKCHFFNKIAEQEGRAGAVWGEGGTSERGGDWGKCEGG
jgi:hypothetical protein